MVLEYASGGDLHTLLKTNGSLDHDSTRFVMGEVTSALASLHEIGLGYFDLKPGKNEIIHTTNERRLLLALRLTLKPLLYYFFTFFLQYFIIREHCNNGKRACETH